MKGGAKTFLEKKACLSAVLQFVMSISACDKDRGPNGKKFTRTSHITAPDQPLLVIPIQTFKTCTITYIYFAGCAFSRSSDNLDCNLVVTQFEGFRVSVGTLEFRVTGAGFDFEHTTRFLLTTGL